MTKVKIGDKVGVGCIVESCLNCKACDDGDELGCTGGHVGTYGQDLKHGLMKTDTGYSHGGYSGRITVHNRFAVKVFKNSFVLMQLIPNSMFLCRFLNLTPWNVQDLCSVLASPCTPP